MTTTPISNVDALPRFRRRDAIGYICRALLIGGLAYLLLYFPYPAGTFPVRLLASYLRLVAHVSAAVAWLFDHNVVATGDLVSGRFSLRIVLDCAALDAHALLAAAVLAFPAPLALRLYGVLAGTLCLAAMNIGRIVTLYVVGMRWPSAFHWMHEEVLQLGVVLCAFLSFLAWIVWARRQSARA